MKTVFWHPIKINSNASPSLSFDAAPFLIQAFDLHMTQIFSRNCEIISTGKLNIEEMKSHGNLKFIIPYLFFVKLLLILYIYLFLFNMKPLL